MKLRRCKPVQLLVREQVFEQVEDVEVTLPEGYGEEEAEQASEEK